MPDRELNKTIVVLTSALLSFEVEGHNWEISPSIHDAKDRTSVRIWYANPGAGTPSLLVAVFTDVHAVYFKDKAELVVADDD